MKKREPHLVPLDLAEVAADASDEEIEKLIQQLYDAMARWQRELAEKMKDPDERRRMEEQAEKMDPNNTITGDDLQKMLDKIREMAKNGDREGAKRALEELRVAPVLVNRAADMHATDCLILPGVGNFADCARLLETGGWTAALRDEVQGYKRPLLGVCVGMQLLADSSTEGASEGEDAPGMGFIPGQVRHLRSFGCTQRVPHVGWNGITRRPPREVEMVHLQFDSPQIIFAGRCLLLGCGGTGAQSANMFRGTALMTLALPEARQLVAGLIAAGDGMAGLVPPGQAAFAPEARL